MEARWIGFSFGLNTHHSWYLPWHQKQAIFLTWKRASDPRPRTGALTYIRSATPATATWLHPQTLGLQLRHSLLKTCSETSSVRVPRVVKVGHKFFCDNMKLSQSSASWWPGSMIPTVSLSPRAPCHAAEHFCENTSQRMPSCNIAQLSKRALSSSSSQKTLLLTLSTRAIPHLKRHVLPQRRAPKCMNPAHDVRGNPRHEKIRILTQFRTSNQHEVTRGFFCSRQNTSTKIMLSRYLTIRRWEKNSSKWIGWMEARWMGFSFGLNTHHSWYLPWHQKQALFLTWKRASDWRPPHSIPSLPPPPPLPPFCCPSFSPTSSWSSSCLSSATGPAAADRSKVISPWVDFDGFTLVPAMAPFSFWPCGFARERSPAGWPPTSMPSTSFNRWS